MNKLIFVIVLLLSGTLMAAGCCKDGAKNKNAACGQSNNAGSKDKHMMNKKDHKKCMEMKDNAISYTCPMESHKHIRSEKPGNCPECGMKMVPVETNSAEDADLYGCPMKSHSHIRSDKPGNCSECGMKLVPMKSK